MKQFFAVIMMTLISISGVSAFADAKGGGSVGSDKLEEMSRNATMGAKVIARNVVDKKLVDADSRRVLMLALQTGKAGFGEIQCERALNVDYCSIGVFIHDDPATDEAEETSFQLDVRIFEGTVVSAEFNLVAG